MPTESYFIKNNFSSFLSKLDKQTNIDLIKINNFMLLKHLEKHLGKSCELYYKKNIF